MFALTLLTIQITILFSHLPPPALLSLYHQWPSAETTPHGWGHVAEPVRLNPNQFLSSGRTKAPNRVYALLMQSACRWGGDDCAIMSSLISFSQADEQGCLVGFVLEGCPQPHGRNECDHCQMPGLSEVYLRRYRFETNWKRGEEKVQRCKDREVNQLNKVYQQMKTGITSGKYGWTEAGE